ncbi:MAG: hypothetical protein Q8P02_02875 [Candidatus Micrarchaeota archaeon]|nr:hypothetical protein [Candidatus Micrarchaeota archaeon]
MKFFALALLASAFLLAGCAQVDDSASVQPTAPLPSEAIVTPILVESTGAFAGGLDGLLLLGKELPDAAFKLQKKELMEKAPSPLPQKGWKSGVVVSFLKSESGETVRLWQIKHEVSRYEPEFVVPAMQAVFDVKQNTQKMLAATENAIRVTRLADPGFGTQSAFYKTELDPDNPNGMVVLEVFFADRGILEVVSFTGPDVTEKAALALAETAAKRMAAA